MTEPPEHYFTAAPASADERRTISVSLAGRDLQLQTAKGVYSVDRLDPGTAVLLREVPAPAASGDLLDIGCGWGPIALTLGLRAPHATVWAIDVNDRSLDLTARNADAAGLANVRACRPEQVPPELRFATIWSNPPIHVGKAVLHDILRTWLPRLTDDGAAYLVVQKHLGSDSLQRWVNEQPWGLACTRRSSAKAFRVLEVRRTS